MNKRILCTTAALLTAALGIPLSCHAESTKADNSNSKDKQAISQTITTAQLKNVVKVGEYQSSAKSKARDAVIARVQPHEIAGRQAVTLYVRNLPVMTFLASDSTANSTTKVGATRNSGGPTDATTQVAANGKLPDLSTQTSSSTGSSHSTDGPIWRATAIAAKLNQLSLDNLDASKVTVKWKSGGKSAPQKAPERYSIAVNNEELVEINANTRLADQTKSLAEDALQVANRLRRLLSNAPPLQEIAGMPKPPKLQLPKPPQNIALGPVRFSLSGLASWYGPGFHGRRSANGEIFNQHAMTAAHRSLPFGTRVRVTHTRSGRSVVVRINDRGPYAGGRIIDLSAAAARVLGLMHSGVAPVRVEVLGR